MVQASGSIGDRAYARGRHVHDGHQEGGLAPEVCPAYSRSCKKYQDSQVAYNTSDYCYSAKSKFSAEMSADILREAVQLEGRQS